MVTDDVRPVRQPIPAEDMVETAGRITGLDDFGDTPFEDGLKAFLLACAEEAELSLFGRLGTRWDVTRFLCNLLCLRHAEVQAPEILQQPIERPLFITGLPRSGTTFLHQLLAADPANGAPRVWEVIHLAASFVFRPAVFAVTSAHNASVRPVD